MAIKFYSKKIVLFIIIPAVLIFSVFIFFLYFLLFTHSGGAKKIFVSNEGKWIAETDLMKSSELEKNDTISIPSFSRRIFDGRDFRVEKVLTNNESYTRHYITYKSGNLKISGIMNVPRGKGPFPVLFLNHGYIDPKVYTNGRGLKREQDYLAKNGYVVVHSDYRNHAESDKEENPDEPDLRFGYAEDVINAIEALKKSDLPYVNKDKIGMLGHSMGGGIALIIAVSRPDLVKAFVLMAPVSADQVDIYEKWTKNDPKRKELTDSFFGAPSENPDFWKEASPLYFFDKVSAPVLIHHGMDDVDCSPEWSEKTAQALLKAGKSVSLYKYPNEPHEFIDSWPLMMQRTLDFFNSVLKE